MRRGAPPALPGFVAQEQGHDGESLDFVALSGYHRCLLVTDGTVTSLIEAYALEPTRTRCLEQRAGTPSQREVRWLATEPGTPTLTRRIVVEGTRSNTPYLSAFSVLIPDRLPRETVELLRREGSSIGTALRLGAVEHRRELLWFARRPGALASRTYRVFVGGVPAILIDEDFLR
jgi:chorismate-pyruvate lyase